MVIGASALTRCIGRKTFRKMTTKYGGRRLTDFLLVLLLSLDLRLLRRELPSPSELDELGGDMDRPLIICSTKGLLAPLLDERRSMVGRMHAARMTDRITRNVVADIRANVNGKRATRPLKIH